MIEFSRLAEKTAVIEHAHASRQDRPSVHLVDKDFDDLLGATVALPTVVYLDRYSLENYILEPLAICRFIVAERPTLTEAAVKIRFDVDGFLRQSIADLRWLFFCFFLVQKHDLQIPNTSQSVARFSHNGQRWRVESTRLKQYERRVIAALGHKNIDLGAERRTYATAFELNRRRRFSGANVSGKYLLALLLQRITSLFRVRGTDLDSATYRIAEYCTLVALRNVQEQVARLLAAHSSRITAS